MFVIFNKFSVARSHSLGSGEKSLERETAACFPSELRFHFRGVIWCHGSSAECRAARLWVQLVLFFFFYYVPELPEELVGAAVWRHFGLVFLFSFS